MCLCHFPLSSAECLKALGHMEAAAESYTKVVEMAPQHLEARLSLATLQQQLGRMDCALKALESMYDSNILAHDSSAAQKAGDLCFRFLHYHVRLHYLTFTMFLKCHGGFLEVFFMDIFW